MATRTSRRSAGAPPKPFTVDHFRLYARKLVLDSGDSWEPEDWQLEVIEDIFDGMQQIWLIVPQGNGKTTLMGGLALYHADFTPSPWVPIGAAGAKQARILYTKAEEFVQRTPALYKRFKPQPGYLRIQSRVNGGWGIQVYAADKDTGEGIIPTLCLVDEPHAQRDLGLYRVWRGKLRKRGGQIAAISTAGEPGTDFEDTRDKIRDGARERRQMRPGHMRYESARIVMHEFKVDPSKVRDLDAVKAANPLSTITKDQLAEFLEDDTLDWGEDWLRRTCNIPARSSKAAISEPDWDAAYTEERIPKGVPIWVGLDVAWVLDTTALQPLWMRSNDLRLLGEPCILEPPRDGTMLAVDDVKSAFLEMQAHNPLEAVVMDTSKAEDLAQWISDELGATVVDRQQSNEWAIKDYEAFTEALREGWLKHTGDRGLRRHVMNAIARKLPSDKYRFDRPTPSRNAAKQDHRVIDALTAAAMVNQQAAGGVTEPFVLEASW
jgi:phage terminase large subunit-like protein